MFDLLSKVSDSIGVLAFLGISSVGVGLHYLRKAARGFPHLRQGVDNLKSFVSELVLARRRFSEAKSRLRAARREIRELQKRTRRSERILQRSSSRPKELLLEVPTVDLVMALAKVGTEGAVRGLISLAQGGKGVTPAQQVAAIEALARSGGNHGQAFLNEITSPRIEQHFHPGAQHVPPFDPIEEHEIYDRIPGRLGREPTALELVKKAIRAGSSECEAA